MPEASALSLPDYEWRSALPDAQERLLEVCRAADPWGATPPSVILEWLPHWADEVPAHRPAAVCLSHEPGPLRIGLSKALYSRWGGAPADVVMSGLADLATTTSHELLHHLDPHLNAVGHDDPVAWQRWIHRGAYGRVEQVALSRIIDIGLLVQMRWPKPKRCRFAPPKAMTAATPTLPTVPLGVWPRDHHVLAGLSITAMFRLFDANPNGWADTGVEIPRGTRLQWPGSSVVWGCAGRFMPNTLWLDQVEPHSSERREIPLACAQAMVVEA